MFVSLSAMKETDMVKELALAWGVTGVAGLNADMLKALLCSFRQRTQVVSTAGRKFMHMKNMNMAQLIYLGKAEGVQLVGTETHRELQLKIYQNRQELVKRINGSATSIVPDQRMPFGKHEGKYFSEIKATDVPYCQWCLNTAVALPLTCHHMLKLLAIYYDLETSCSKFWLLTTTWYYDMEPMLKAAAPRPENVRIQHSNDLLDLKLKLQQATDSVELQFDILRRLAASTASASSRELKQVLDDAQWKLKQYDIVRHRCFRNSKQRPGCETEEGKGKGQRKGRETTRMSTGKSFQ